MAKSNLFDTAVKKSPAKAASKDKEEINVTLLKDEKGKPRFPGAAQLLVDYQKYHAQAAEAKAMLETKGAQIKEVGLELWAEKFEQSGVKPESFILTGQVEHIIEGQEPIKLDGRLMFIASDSYKKVNEIAATVLESKYNCIERKETFSFNNELLNKYRDQISQALMSIKGISDEEKALLIHKSEDVSIKKGTIENVQLIASITGKPVKPKAKKGDEEEPVYDKFESVKDLVAQVEPTFSLKNC